MSKSILIRGVSMPKSCNDCKLDLRTDICQAFCEWNAEHPYSIRATDRLPDCPLSEATEPCEDTISRQSAIQAAECIVDHHAITPYQTMRSAMDHLQRILRGMPSAQPEWIPCSERMPDDLEVVNITWINHEPEPYYHDIEDKSFVASGVHYRGKWYWYSTTCADYLGEYGSNEVDLVDDAIEITAWMPLPESYRGDEQNG